MIESPNVSMLTAVLLAIILIMIYATLKWRIDANDVEGYWRVVPAHSDIAESPIFHIEPTGKRTVKVRGLNGDDYSEWDGDVRYLRRICFNGYCGSMDLSGRHMSRGDKQWIREGLYSCLHCV